MKLFTIGDSISQGFMSFAAARTGLSYSTLLQKALDPAQHDPYYYPRWPFGGMPANLELIFRKLDKRFGPDIRGPIEWPLALRAVNSVLDESEAYYERGDGNPESPYPENRDHFHNVAVWGFTVADAWLMTPRVCREAIRADPRSWRDEFFQGASQPFHRTALTVLNPSRQEKFEDLSAIDWLAHHARTEGVENVILWLGPNNALGTVINLEIVQTPNDPSHRPHELTRDQREAAGWNLWHPDDFEAEYSELLKRLERALANNKFSDWRVFIGNVPLVTIAPLAKGVGPTYVRKDPRFPNLNDKTYFKYYTYFPFEEEDVHEGIKKLTISDAYKIDLYISRYNQSIAKLVKRRNHGRQKLERFHIVDFETHLSAMAWKRNAGNPTYEFPELVQDLNPVPNTKYYHGTRAGSLEAGGIFSLDGIHPTAIGQGLVAWEFLKVMKAAGVKSSSGQTVSSNLDWPAIVRSDALYTKPIRIMSELRENKDLIQFVTKLFGII